MLRYVAISGGAVLLLLVFLPDVLAPEKDKKQGKRAAGQTASDDSAAADETGK